ncbi:hypothetical protein A6R68_13411, partial [Neotoma lepida]
DVQLFSTMNECHYDKRMDFFYNRSNADTADEWTGTKLLIVLCVGTFFCLFIFFSNSLVIAAVITNRKFHFPFYYLLANLAAADFFAGIAYVFLMFNTGPVSKTLTVNRWFLRQGLLDASLTASLANLLVIAVERHMSIMKMRVHSNLTKKRVTLLILLVWAIAIFMGAVPTLGWNCLCNISACSSLAPIYSRSYLIFWTVSNLLAFFIMVVVYVRIYMYVKRKTNDVQLFSTMNECHYDKRMDFFYNRSNADTADEWTGTKLLIVLCVGTFFCLFIFFSNSLVIAAVITNRKFHFPFYYLLANLAAADFFAGIAYVFLMFNTGPVSKTLTVNRWFLRQGLLDASLTASLANLLVIAVERHMSIMKMRVHSNLTKKRVTLLILLVWAIAIFMGAVPTLGWNCLCNISACSSLAPIYSRSYLIFWTVSNLLAFFIMVVVYVRIYMYVKRKTNVPDSVNDSYL